MKKIKYITVAITVVLGLSSCSDFLTTQLVDSTTTDSYYKTPQEAFTALTGCYNGLDLICLMACRSHLLRR